VTSINPIFYKENIFCYLTVARILVNAGNKHETQNLGSSNALCSRQDAFPNISVYPSLDVPRGGKMDARMK